jgi:hypothetical protein
MYYYVEDKEFLSRGRRCCSELLTEVKELLYQEYDINIQFTLIGSGARNMVTQNEDEAIDYDYNFNVINYDCSLKELKDRTIEACNKILTNKELRHVDDSTSSITTKPIHFTDDPSIEFRIDIALISKNDDHQFQRLIHDKRFFPNRYYWVPAPNSKDYQEKAKAIKQVGAWNLVRDAYLNLKNHYLTSNDYVHPSFICYIEAVNNIYNQLKQLRKL